VCKKCRYYRLVKERVESKGGSGLCSGCDPNSTKRTKTQEESVQKALINADWQEWSDSELPPLGYFKREHMIDFACITPIVNGTAYQGEGRSRLKKKQPKGIDELRLAVPNKCCKIDFILSYEGGFIFLEVDERQHRFGFRQGDSAAIACDARRMANVHTSITLEFASVKASPPSIYWLRFNPSEFHVDGKATRIAKEEREKRLCAFLSRFEPVAPVVIGYAFYDYSETIGLDVLQAPEFPEALSCHVRNLEALQQRSGTGHDSEQRHQHLPQLAYGTGLCADSDFSYVQCTVE
jgi:hypothetical protein